MDEADWIVSAVVAEHEYRLAIGDELEIGRTAQPGRDIVGLDPDDDGISRRSVRLRVEQTGVLVQNLSTKTTIYLDPPTPGPSISLLPGKQALAAPPTGFEVRGAIRTHRIQIVGSDASSHTPTIPVDELAGAQTALPVVRFSESDKDAFVAVFRGYLEAFPRRDCQPLSYRQAGRLLGVPGSTVRRRVERSRERLAGAGVWIDGPNALRELATYLLDMQVIGPSDLDRLPGTRP